MARTTRKSRTKRQPATTPLWTKAQLQARFQRRPLSLPSKNQVMLGMSVDPHHVSVRLVCIRSPVNESFSPHWLTWTDMKNEPVALKAQASAAVELSSAKPDQLKGAQSSSLPGDVKVGRMISLNKVSLTALSVWKPCTFCTQPKTSMVLSCCWRYRSCTPHSTKSCSCQHHEINFAVMRLHTSRSW